ncbi:MAG TPA: glycoside hydrolase family 88 protein [Candidatus Paceibacterota bacterium]|nr:glycoside hydrolase family 88 protein [Candidatus Paceibacterota bacterium]
MAQWYVVAAETVIIEKVVERRHLGRCAEVSGILFNNVRDERIVFLTRVANAHGMNVIARPAADDLSGKINGHYEQTLAAAFNLCICKTRGNIERLADVPKSAAWAEDGNYFNFKESFYEIGNWTSSFFTGMALLAWRETEDEYFLTQTLRLAPHYHEKAFVRFMDTHHDIGFLYSLYSVALYKLTGEKEHREVGVRAAELLAQRFNPKGNYIRAWGRMDEIESPIGDGMMRTDNMAIIDSLMNLPLLFWASAEQGDTRCRDIAVRHADMSLKCFVRPDGSTNNIYRFDPHTGAPLGDPNNSYWARGATWAIYGLALTYGYTGLDRYLEASIRLAKKFIAQLDNEIIPWNDFHETAHPARVRDASAGALAVCGFQELAKLRAADSEILTAKRVMLEKLCSEDYLNFDDACFGIQRRGQGGKNGYTSWGDYFLMEALARELTQCQLFW